MERQYKPTALGSPFVVVSMLFVGCLCGCGLTDQIVSKARTAHQPDIGKIYNRSAQSDETHRNPVIVIPGILGTRLEDGPTGRTVWGEVNRKSIDPEDAEGARIVAHPMGWNTPLNQLNDDVVERGTVGSVTVKIAGIPIEQQAYGKILSSLGVGGYLDEGENTVDYGEGHFTCFQFSYDWRRDNAENAARLGAFMKEKAAYVREQREKRFGITDRPVKFDVVAHSMGGLIARYYLRYGSQPLSPTPMLNWEGSKNVERLIVVGTPSGGSVDAVTQLVDGYKLGPFLPKYQAAVLGTMPSIYQLLPRDRHRSVIDEQQQIVPMFDVGSWQKYGWGLLDPRQDEVLQNLLPETNDRSERQRIAENHLAKCLDQADRFHRALDQTATPPRGTTIHLIAGDAEPTESRVTVSAQGQITVTETAPGDGTVTRRSALMDERDPLAAQWSPRLVTPIDWQSVNFFFAGHIELTRNVEFTDNLLYLLLEAPRKNSIDVRPIAVSPNTSSTR